MQPSDAVFQARGRFVYATAGDYAVAYDQACGGVMTFGLGADHQGVEQSPSPLVAPSALPPSCLRPVIGPVAVRVRLTCTAQAEADDYQKSVLIKQEYDCQPRLSFLEEGPQRVALRVEYRLLDELGHYHGDGLLEAYLYPEGDLVFQNALRLIDNLSHSVVQDAWLELPVANCSGGELGTGDRLQFDASSPVCVGLQDELPGRYALLGTKGGPSAALYWHAHEDLFDWAASHGITPPYYEKWPRKYDQGWGARTASWPTHPSARLCVEPTDGGMVTRLQWLTDQQLPASGLCCRGIAVLSLADSAAELRRRVGWFQNPVLPEATEGAVFRQFDEADGALEIAQKEAQARIVLPADAEERVVRFRIFRNLRHPFHAGAITLTCDGQPLRAQLISEGEYTDDPLVVTPFHKHGTTDEAIASVSLRADGPRVIEYHEQAGVQACYQRRSEHRNIVFWSDKNPRRGLFELSLADLRARHFVSHGQTEPAIWENELTGFLCSYIFERDYMVNLREFRIEKNGPDAVELYWRSVNGNDRCQSETWLRVPYDYPRFRMEVALRVTVLESWTHNRLEVYDIFPYPTRIPRNWHYQTLLHANTEGGLWITEPQAGFDSLITEGPANQFTGAALFTMFASDLGNLVVYMHDIEPPGTVVHHGLCYNYTDHHVTLDLKEAPQPGDVFGIKYELELFGDAQTTLEQVKQIAEQSLQAGGIRIPE